MELIDNRAIIGVEELESGELGFLQHMKLYHNSQSNAVQAKQLVQFGHERKLRRTIHKLRLLGYPICSGDRGYFYASHPEEMQECLHRLKGTALQTLEVLAALYLTKTKMESETNELPGM